MARRLVRTDRGESRPGHRGSSAWLSQRKAARANIVIATNQVDGQLVVRGNAKVSRVPGNVAAPVNFAMAQANTCTGCQTIAVALQIDVASKDAGHVARRTPRSR